jgi:hypothetical protein
VLSNRLGDEQAHEEDPGVGDGVNLAYDTAGLRAGAGGLQQTAADADQAGSALGAAPLEPIMFGRTPGAAVFAAAVQAARAAQARGFRHESERATGLSGRADTAAGLGDGLTAESGAVARSAAPR